MSTGIVSSKEGHDESHISYMKLGPKFWNAVDNVTIGVTQKYWHKGCFNCRGKLLTSLWTLGGTTKDLATLNQRGRTQYDIGQCILWRLKGVTWPMKVDQLIDKLIYPIDWMKCRQVSCSKVTRHNHFICKMNWFPSLNFPIMIDECLFSFLQFKEGNKHSL